MAQTGGLARPRRGDVYLVGFDPSLGAEIKKTRPALVLQNDLGNRHSAITMVAAITSATAERRFPVQVAVKPPEGGLQHPSVVQLNQIRSVDKRRLIRRLGRLTPRTMKAVDRATSISLGLIPLDDSPTSPG